MKFEQIEQRSEKWYAARLGRPTASNFHKIIQPGRLKRSASAPLYMAQLVAEKIFKRSFDKDISDLPAIRWGVEHEPQALQRLQIERGFTALPGGFMAEDGGRYGASPDAIVALNNRRELVEIKCPYDVPRHVRTLLFGMDDDYKCQVQGQLLISGYECVHFYSYHPDCPPRYIRVDPDEQFIAALRRELDSFCAELELQYQRAKDMGGWNNGEGAAGRT